jgi:hypothetical protein
MLLLFSPEISDVGHIMRCIPSGAGRARSGVWKPVRRNDLPTIEAGQTDADKGTAEEEQNEQAVPRRVVHPPLAKA